MNVPSHLNVTLSPQSPQSHLDQPGTLAVVRFACDGASDPDPRIVTTPLAHRGAALNEIWTTTGPVSSGQDGDIAYARGEDVLMAHLALPDDGSDIRGLAYTAYQRMLAWLAQQEGFQLWRCWNIFAQVNAGEGDRERYREFSVGRFAALEEAEMADCHLFPAATAIGSATGPLFLMILAGRKPAALFENPRQVSAWNYPRQYGPRSPSFARAAQTPVPPGAILVSGTASVVGHETRHVGNWQGQLQETLTNLESLLKPVNPEARPAALRLYVRAGQPVQQIVDALHREAGDLPLIVLEGDVCRSDLLLEIEGVWV